MDFKFLNLKSFILLGLFCCLGASCDRNDNPIPKVPVNFYINPNDVLYLNLNYIGGHEYFTGGVSGVVVYRLGDWEFTAFDRACPHDWDEDDSWIWVEPDGITLRCQKCQSLFNILDGGLITGPSKYPLRQYYTRFDGMRLRVHS
jgi:nitrite reductase/ring-hydroxylating ferredoxin subunit